MSGDQPDGGDSKSGEETVLRESESDGPFEIESDAPLEELAARLPADRRDVDDADREYPDADRDDLRGGVDAPLEGIAGDVRKRRERSGRDEGPFQEMSVGTVDTEDAWDRLLSDDGTDDDLAVGAGASPTDLDAVGGRNEHVVPKEQFCSHCPHLSDPPTVECKHDGTEILEVTDSEHFRVRDCPFTENPGTELETFD